MSDTNTDTGEGEGEVQETLPGDELNLDPNQTQQPEIPQEFVEAFESEPEMQYTYEFPTEDAPTDGAQSITEGVENEDVIEGQEESSSAAESQTPADSTQPSTPPTPDPAQITILEDWSVPTSEAPALRELYDWARSLTPDQHQAVNAVLSGQYYLVPVQSQAPVQGSGERSAVGATVHPGQPAADPTSTTTPSPADSNLDNYLDPQAAQDIQSLRQQLAQMEQVQRAQQESAAQAEMQRQQAALQSAFLDSKTNFATERGLDEAGMNRLIEVTTSLGIVPQLVQQYQHDPKQAFLKAFETALYADPNLRQIELDRLASQQLATQQQAAARKAKASSVGGGSAPVPRQPIQRRVMSNDEKLDAMAEMIANNRS